MSDCACLYGGYDDDGPQFSNESFVTARKAHTCFECQRAIRSGERYYRFVGKWDGEVSTFKTCAECADIASSLYCDSRTFGQLWEEVEEQIFREGGLTVACVDKLTTPEAKRFLQQRWMEYLEIPR